METTATTNVVDGRGTDDGDDAPPPDAEARLLFSTAVARDVEFDVDVPWPRDPRAMMRAHYPTQTWPVRGARPRVAAEEARKHNVCVIIGGTDDTRALVVGHVARHMASFSDEPYAAVVAMLHPLDRGTAVGRALMAHAPPSCLHGDAGPLRDPMAHVARTRRRRLFLACVSPHVDRDTRSLILGLSLSSRFLLCDVVLAFDGCAPWPALYSNINSAVLLPPLALAPGHFLARGGAVSSINDALAGGRSILFSCDDLIAAPFDVQQETSKPEATAPPHDQFHAHVAWRLHYALTRAGSHQTRETQRQLASRATSSTLAALCARGCVQHLDSICDVDIPVECLERILEAAALSIDLADDSRATYAALAALRRCLSRCTSIHATDDMPIWPAIAIVRHFVRLVTERVAP